jgi:excisionase family DNA binding protein
MATTKGQEGLMGIIDRVAKRLGRGIMGQNSSEVDMPKRLISVTEAAKETGLSLAYLRRLVATGRVKGQKIGSCWAIEYEALHKFLSKPRKIGRPPLDK